MVILFLVLITAVIIGVMAQQVKHRTGAAWGALTLLVCGGLIFLLFWASTTDPQLRRNPDLINMVTVFGCILGGGLMAILVATLPKAITVRQLPDAPGISDTNADGRERLRGLGGGVTMRWVGLSGARGGSPGR